MTVSYWQRTASRLPQIECDVCVLGAGISGASAALWLRRRGPRLRVAVVEARTAASGASGRNAGMLLAGLSEHYDRMTEVFGRERARQIWAATLEHQRLLREFLTETRTDVDLEECGSWRLAYEETEAAHLSRSAEMLKADGFPAEFYEKDPLGRGFHGALGIPHDAGLHPVKLVGALLNASGAEIYGGCEVFCIESETDGLLVRTSGADFRAKKVFIALNAFAPLVHAHFRPLVAAHRGQILVTAPLGSRVLGRMVYAHHGYIYFRQFPDGRLLLGGWRHEFAEREAGYADETTEDVQGSLERFLLKYFPETRGMPVEARWAGTMGFSHDGLPLVGALPEDGRVCYAVGYTGHGFGLALEVTRRAVGLLLEGEGAGVFAADRLTAGAA
ncbi:MAG TPA: FAD-dependent oxidoreductase [Pyrinomonadaceae bacterium]|nr:FAD-dependent oxidoreductase [Pyrinomonadaceae bacterium]